MFFIIKDFVYLSWINRLIGKIEIIVKKVNK